MGLLGSIHLSGLDHMVFFIIDFVTVVLSPLSALQKVVGNKMWMVICCSPSTWDGVVFFSSFFFLRRLRSREVKQNEIFSLSLAYCYCFICFCAVWFARESARVWVCHGRVCCFCVSMRLVWRLMLPWSTQLATANVAIWLPPVCAFGA